MTEPNPTTDAAQINYISLNEEIANSTLSPKTPQETSPLQKVPQAPVTPQPIDHGLRRVVISAVAFAACVTVALILQIYLGPPQVKPHGAIAVDAEAPCATVGATIMQSGGTAVDAAIASVLCASVVSMHKTGIGGGGFMLVHSMRDHLSVAFDFRESAPLALDPTVFNTSLKPVPKGMTVAVPGLVKGLYEAHKKFGRLAWSQLFDPAIKLAEDGVPVTLSLVKALGKVNRTEFDSSLADIFFPKGVMVSANQTIKLPNLAATLRKIAAGGSDGFYKGTVATDIVTATTSLGGVMNASDLDKYTVYPREPMQIAYKGYQVLTVPPPASGPALAMMLNIMNGAVAALETVNGMFYHTMAEAMKYGYGVQMNLGDPESSSEVANVTRYSVNPTVGQTRLKSIGDHNHTMDINEYTKLWLPYDWAGASHISVIDSDDMIVSLTTSLNRPFGSKLMTAGGIILNDAIYDFTWPDMHPDKQQPPFSTRNILRAGSRPLSPMAPAIFFDQDRVCGPRGAVGGSNGSRIVSGVMQTLMNLLQFNVPVQDAIDRPRIHSGIFPDIAVELEKNADPAKSIDPQVKGFLESLGHNVVWTSEGLNVIQGVTKVHFDLYAHSDYRGAGTTAKF